jgi:4-hydroxy-2-oxoheptanedioate aldolase
MSKSEFNIVQALQDLAKQLLYVKAEFEAEGTRADELALLKSIVSAANSNLVIKIGGSSAFRDLIECSTLETSFVLVPMIETPEALSTFLRKRRELVSTLGLPSLFAKVLINVETITAVKNLEKILGVANQYEELIGIVIGRTDLSQSLQISRDDIESEQVLEICSYILSESKKEGLRVTLGGSITNKSYSFILNLIEKGLDAFETRKCCISAASYTQDEFTVAIQKALLFEQKILLLLDSLSKITYKQKVDRIQAISLRK